MCKVEKSVPGAQWISVIAVITTQSCTYCIPLDSEYDKGFPKFLRCYITVSNL